MKMTNAIIEPSNPNEPADPLWARRKWAIQKAVLGISIIARFASTMPVQADWCDETGCYGCLVPGCSVMVATFESLSIEPAYGLPDYDRKILARDTRSRQFGHAFAVADFNKDGRPDLAAHIHSPDLVDPVYAVRIYLQNGQGEFVERDEQSLPALDLTFFLRTGDFNEDGNLDLLMDDAGNDLLMMRGKGDGTFDEATPLGLGVSGFFKVDDFNGDRHLDLAAGNLADNGSVSVFLGNGTGHFTPRATLETFVIPFFPPRGEIMTADFNLDGKVDLAVASPPDLGTDVGNLDVFLGNGDGTFKNVIRTERIAVRRGTIGDFNRDGIPDFAGDRSSPNSVETWLGKGDGQFTKGEAFPLTFPGVCWGIKAADVNHDGIDDVLVSGQPALRGEELPPINVFVGNGDGNFQSRQLLSTVAPFKPINESPEVVDLNLDGYLDIVGLAASATGEEVLSATLSKGVKRDPTRGVLLSITARRPQTFILETSSDLATWTGLLTNSVFAPRFNDTDGGSAHRFYRVRR